MFARAVGGNRPYRSVTYAWIDSGVLLCKKRDVDQVICRRASLRVTATGRGEMRTGRSTKIFCDYHTSLYPLHFVLERGHAPPGTETTGSYPSCGGAVWRGFFYYNLLREARDESIVQSGVAEILLETARIYHLQGTWHVHLLLLMPDHLHAIIGMAGDAELSESVRTFKRITTRKAGVKWQRNYFDHRIRHDEGLKEKSDYILQNPVRAGLVAREEDWEWVVFGDARGTWGNRVGGVDGDGDSGG